MNFPKINQMFFTSIFNYKYSITGKNDISIEKEEVCNLTAISTVILYMYFTDKSNVRTYIHVLPLPRMNRIIVIVTLLRITSSFRHPKTLCLNISTGLSTATSAACYITLKIVI